MSEFKGGHGVFHVRTCQECGHEQSDNVPKIITDTWLEKECKKCKSPALDFGSSREYVNGKRVEWEETE